MTDRYRSIKSVAAMWDFVLWRLWLVVAINIRALASPLNQSISLVLPNLSNDYDITCDGSKYGVFQNRDVTACVDATKVIASGRDRETFAIRYTAEATDDTYPLPWRWMDGG